MLARSLALAGIETTVITDSAVFAIMSRVNKVTEREKREIEGERKRNERERESKMK